MIRQLNRFKWVLTAVSVATLSACASYDVQKGLDRVNTDTKELTQGELQLARTENDRQKRQALTSKILAKQLGQTESVQLMLANSPAFQSLMAQNWSDAASAAQSGRISNPVFTYESVVTGSETEITRFLSFGLLDLLTLPQRSAMAEFRIEQAQLKFAAEVIDRVTQVKQAWVKAVAAEQSFVYAQQVYESAQVSAELARRMEAVGNFNRLTRARHQAFYADAATQLVTAKQNAVSKREELVRLFGLDQEQAQMLTLPSRLPEIPKQPMSDEEVGRQASRSRLDVQLAKANLNASAKAQGLVGITSLTDIEMTARKGRVTDSDTGTSSSPRGYEVVIRLPIFDWGSMRRDAMTAQTLAAANNLEATIRAAGSGLRESYAAYRSAYDISRHYKDEVLPLRKVMADENVLRYNGMIIGVFELLADARDQVSTVISAISADQQFWLADAALKANLMGRPMSVGLASMPSTSSSAAAGH
jgi:outer membrane protein TolC